MGQTEQEIWPERWKGVSLQTARWRPVAPSAEVGDASVTPPGAVAVGEVMESHAGGGALCRGAGDHYRHELTPSEEGTRVRQHGCWAASARPLGGRQQDWIAQR
jgi:hypothetical protein